MKALSVTLLALASGAVSAAGLEVEINGIAAAEGQLKVAVHQSADTWGGGPPASGRVVPAEEGSMTLSMPELGAGEYAIMVHHDRNGNDVFDTNVVGIPIEGWGFSNNPMVMRQATFDEAKFTLDEAGATIVIELR